jgi:hypothetical protein
MSRQKRQNDELLAALGRKAMTATEIWNELGIARASARVFDLRSEGHDIRSTEITVRNRHGEPCRVALYSLASRQMALVPVHPGRGVMAA